MFEIGELVACRSNIRSVGVVIATKKRFGIQYCNILWKGETTPHWVSYEQLAEHI